MECQLPHYLDGSFQVVSAQGTRRRGGDGRNSNVLRVCGVHTAISKQTRVGKAEIKFSAI